MKEYKRFFRNSILMLIINTGTIMAGWEIISPNPKLMDIEIMGDTWFGIEYHGTSSNSLFLTSNNNGQRWDTLSDFATVSRIRVHKDRILARGIYQGWLGFYLSSDSAKTWQKLNWPYSVGPLDMLLNDTAIFVFVSKSSAVESPLYRSLDTGKTWHPLPVEAGDVNWNGGVPGINLAVNGNTIGAFLNGAGFHISNDGGNTWIKRIDGLPEVTTNYGPLTVLPEGFSVRYYGGWYIFNGTGWTKKSYTAYAFFSEYDKWKEITNGIPIPNACQYRAPYMFAVNGDAGEFIYYSLDNGNKWFMFSEPGTEFTSAFESSIVISGNYAYAGFSTGFARRSLSEAINHMIIEEEEVAQEYPVSPEEMKNALGLLGAGELEELLEEMGIDAEGLSNEEMRGFLDDYLEDGGSSDLFANSQPGSCSYMGMPLWSMNVTNLRLFVRDMIFRKKGIGPELKIAMNYLHVADSTDGFFGKHWRFEYEHFLTQNDSSVTLTTGTGAVFVFSENEPVVTGTSPFSLRCLNNDKYKLHWTGSKWQAEKGIGFEFLNFEPAGGDVFILSSVEDTYSKKITIGYNAENKPVLISDGSGREFRLTYSNNLCDSIKLPDGRYAIFAYNSRKQLISSTDLNGVETRYAYDNVRNIKTVDIAGKTTTFDYSFTNDSLGIVSDVTDPEGRKTAYFSALIDTANRLTNIIYPGNKTVTYQSCNGMVTAVTNPGGEVKKIFYNPEGRPDSLVWYDGSCIAFSYDADGNIIAKRDRSGKLTAYEYNENRKLLNEKDAKGETVYTYSYDTKGQLESIAVAGGTITSFTYDDNGALASVKTADDNIRSFGRDAYGNVISYTNPLGNTRHFFYHAEGLLLTGRTDYNGNHYGIAYDNNGRLQEIIMPDGNKRTFVYDCCTQTGITDENGNTVLAVRDATNRILEKITAEGISHAVMYDERGFISGFITKYGRVKNLRHNHRGLLNVVSDEDGSIIYEYNEGGQPVSVTDKKGNETRYSYTEKGELAAITDAAGSKILFAFNDEGKLISLTNARNQTTSLVYDASGSVAEKSLDGSPYATYEYNSKGELVSCSDLSGTTTYTRNAVGFVTGILYPGGLTVGFKHDANGNVTEITYPNGMVVTNTPDEMNRLVSIGWGTSSIDFEYDPAGNLLSENRSNTTQTLYGYNKDNVLLDVRHVGSDTVFAGETIRMEDGIISGMNAKIIPPVSIIPVRLLNISSNNLNQVEQSFFNQLSFSYDKDGNLTAFTDKEVTRMTASYTHDNLIAAIHTSGKTSEMGYDAMRYPRKMVSGGVTAYLFYDHKGRLLFETDHAGNLTKNYIYRGKRLIACQTANNEVYFYHYSRSGHTLAMTGSNGAIMNAYAYSGHGEVIGKEESTDNRFTFLGAFGSVRFDDKYILTGARVYSAQMGRYIQRDPLGIITGTNPYLYASNNPVSGIDPLGLEEQSGTVNTQSLDPSSDNDYNTAGGSANPYADNMPYRENYFDISKTAISNTVKDFFDHPASDLLPDFVGNPVSVVKAIDALAEKKYGKALWQFIPFNNSMEAAADYIQSKTKYNDPAKFSELGIFGNFNSQKTFSCDL